MLGYPIARPPLGGDREGVLGGFFGTINVTEEADQGRQDPAPFAPEDLLDQKAPSVGMSTRGRTSTAPPSRIAGIPWANSRASSRLAASST